jgi:hypothetical protein
VRIECNHGRHGLLLPRPLDHGAQDLLVTQVHAVEVSDRYNRAAL